MTKKKRMESIDLIILGSSHKEIAFRTEAKAGNRISWGLRHLWWEAWFNQIHNILFKHLFHKNLEAEVKFYLDRLVWIWICTHSSAEARKIRHQWPENERSWPQQSKIKKKYLLQCLWYASKGAFCRSTCIIKCRSRTNSISRLPSIIKRWRYVSIDRLQRLTY